MNVLKKILKIPNTEYNYKSIWQNTLFVLVAVLMIAACFNVQDSAGKHVRNSVFYPIADVSGHSQYIKQFDAFKKGQLHLDMEVSDELLALENPYDPDARDDSGAEYYWDHVYFEGKYYSYFGIAPLLTVYLPYYIIKDALPNDAVTCIVLAIYAVIFSALAYREVVIRFCKKANLWLFLLGEIAFIMSTGIYLGLLCTDMYYIAVISAVASSMAFVFFSFRAMREKNIILRAILLVFSALSLTLTVLSRPTAAIMCIAVFPIFAEFLFRIKRNTLRDSLITVGAFVLPLAAGAAFVMWYNAARFGSPFDFGANYQLTVSDVSLNKLQRELLFSSVFSYFLYPFWIIKEKPYVIMGNQLVLPPEYYRYFYKEKYIGALAHGLPIGVLLYGRVVSLDEREGNRDHAKNALVMLSVLLSVFIAFFNFCYAGVNMRYIYDIVPLLSLVGGFIVLDLQGRSKGFMKLAYTLLSLVLFAVSFLAYTSVIETIREYL